MYLISEGAYSVQILHNKIYKINKKEEEEVMNHNTNIHINQATTNT